MGRCMDMWRVLRVRAKFVAVRAIFSLSDVYSELLAPEELLPYLLHPNIAFLDPEMIAVYIQAANKIFGYWATEAAQQWTDDLLVKVQGAVETMIEQMEEFVSSPHIEVQERVSRSSPDPRRNMNIL